MSIPNVWDDPDLVVTDNYAKFENVGDKVTGTVVAVRKHVWDDGSACPQLLLDVNGEEVMVTAGQVRLKAALADKRPAPGQTITIELTQIEKRAGGKTLKHFDVTVGGPVTGVGIAGIAAAPPAAPAAGGYTPEQLEAMAALGITPPQ